MTRSGSGATCFASFVFFGLLVVSACSSDASDGSPLQSECVHEHYGNLARTKKDGSSCNNFGFSDCGHVFASECTNVCAHSLCQSSECASDADCSALGATCTAYVVSGKDFGMYCKKKDTPGDPSDLCDGCGGIFCSGKCIGCPGC